MSRVPLARIKALTFYKDTLTSARRGDPILQLTCIGRPCDLYQPDVVRCTSLGGEGTDIDWKCEADLPEALRFGKVEVSCEGWSGPGDPYVLKGSCGLSYRLVQVPDALRKPGQEHAIPSRATRWLRGQDPASILFSILWMAVLAFILYSFLKSCFAGRTQAGRPNTHRPSGPAGGGWFSGSRRNDYPDNPPPYSKHPHSSNQSTEEPWRPGFWSGAALGGLGTYLMNRRQDNTRTYDWERERRGPTFRTSPIVEPSSRRWTGFSTGNGYSYEDRGEGSSNLGQMRRSTGMGGSSVR